MMTENTDSASSEPEHDRFATAANVPVATALAPAMHEPRAPEPAPKATVVVSESLGLRLRAAREARGLTCEAAAQQLRLPVSILQAIETERFDRIGHAIYLRSYLTKYLQLLDLPQVLAERVLHEHAAPAPQLVTTGTVSRPRYLFNRYSGSALYLILTGVIVVPAVLLAMRAGFDQNLVRVAPLETPEVSTPMAKPAEIASATNRAAAPTLSAESAAGLQEKTTTAPLIASMAPFPASAATAEKPDAPAANSGMHTLRMHLAEASWVEIIAADGQKLEYGLIPAGSTRSYDSTKALDVRIGNANGATFEVDGKARDIAPFRHSNVAHFKLAEGETTAPHSGG